jgi:RNA polymerase sigma factor (TIGR02999 family)
MNSFNNPETNISFLLVEWKNGKKEALDQVIPLIYNELHLLAKIYLSKQHNHSLQATALVNELYIKLLDCQKMDLQNKAHFLAVAAKVMRNILVDHARKYLADKREGARYKISLSAVKALSKEPDLDLLALDDALSALALADLQQSNIVELRYFGGLSIEEIAIVLNISTATVSREWKLAKFFLLHYLNKP